jgi:ABC-2 type transport system ATP-binding protein
MAAETIVEADGLTRYFGPNCAVDDLAFTAARGEVLGLLGPNGSGKTTTLRMLAGLLAPSRGHVRIAGADVAADPIAARRSLGYLPEQVAVYDDMTVEAYLRFMARLRGVRRRELGDRVDQAIVETGLADVRRRVIGVVSKGYRQRVGIAAAIVHRPAFLILDEPTSALDPRQVVEIRDLIARLGEQRTVLLSTHVLTEATNLCDRVVILSRGRSVAVGRPDELAARVKGVHRARLRVRAAPDDVERVLASVARLQIVDVAGDGSVTSATIETADDAALPAVARVVAAEGWDLLEMSREPADLEQAFLALTT